MTDLARLIGQKCWCIDAGLTSPYPPYPDRPVPAEVGRVLAAYPGGYGVLAVVTTAGRLVFRPVTQVALVFEANPEGCQ